MPRARPPSSRQGSPTIPTIRICSRTRGSPGCRSGRSRRPRTRCAGRSRSTPTTPRRGPTSRPSTGPRAVSRRPAGPTRRLWRVTPRTPTRERACGRSRRSLPRRGRLPRGRSLRTDGIRKNLSRPAENPERPAQNPAHRIGDRHAAVSLGDGSTPMRRLFAPTLALCALLTVGAGTARATAHTVREPSNSIPPIRADSDVELFFEYGRQSAKDRLGQFVLLARFARGTAAGLFGSGSLNSDVGTRSLQYSSSELNDMFAKLPATARAGFDAYIAGVNAEINAVLAGAPPTMPVEVGTAVALGQGDNLFGNKTNLSDQVDPGWSPTSQFTRELTVAMSILQVRNFGSSSGFGNEFDNLQNLLRLQAKFGPSDGFAIWNDLHFLNDPLAPVSVPDPTTPGFGGPLSARLPAGSDPGFFSTMLAWLRAGPRALRDAFAPAVAASTAVARGSTPALWRPSLPDYAYADAMELLRAQAEAREKHMRAMSAWPMIGSYMWAIDGARSQGGDPWLGGFPQTGIQTPSIMHAAELSSGEGTAAVGMAFVGGPSILIGETPTLAWTTTTAGLKNTSLVEEELVHGTPDAVRYDDEGTPTPMAKRNETFQVLGAVSQTRTFFRTHVRMGNGGTRPVASFIADLSGTARPGSSATAVVTAGGLTPGAFAGGHVLLNQGPGAGQIRQILNNDATTLTISAGNAFTTAQIGRAHV